eukprot:gene7778-15914_t
MMEALVELHGITVGSGTNSKETLLAQELAKLNDRKLKMKAESADYLLHHPELQSYLDGFVAGVLSHKPQDLIDYGLEYFTKLKIEKESKLCKSLPLVFAGPSGVGKGTLVGQLMSRYPKHFGFSVSHTTRQPRPGEENGIHYNFVEKSLMEEAISRGEFIEYANVHTNIYGTSYAAVEKVQRDGKICILDIDIQGVQNVKKSSLKCKYIFIAPPSMEILEERLRGRGTETEEKVQIRLDNARGEMEFGAIPGNFDATVVNDDLEIAIQQLMDKIKSWYPERNFDS